MCLTKNETGLVLTYIINLEEKLEKYEIRRSRQSVVNCIEKPIQRASHHQ